MTHALDLKPLVTVLLKKKKTSEASVPFPVSVYTAGWLNMSLIEVQ